MYKLKFRIVSGFILFGIIILTSCEKKQMGQHQSLANNWQLKSSVPVPENESYISTVEYKPQQWFNTSVPSTVLNAMEKDGKENIAHITVENSTEKLAFFIHLQITKRLKREEVLRTFWDVHYFTLLPKENRELKETFAMEDLNGADPVIEV